MCLCLFTSITASPTAPRFLQKLTRELQFYPSCSVGQTDGQLFFFLFSFGFHQRLPGFSVSLRYRFALRGFSFSFLNCHESRHAFAATAAACYLLLLQLFLAVFLLFLSIFLSCVILASLSFPVLSSEHSLFSLWSSFHFLARSLASPYRTLHATTASPARARLYSFVWPIRLVSQTFLAPSCSPLNTR